MFENHSIWIRYDDEPIKINIDMEKTFGIVTVNTPFGSEVLGAKVAISPLGEITIPLSDILNEISDLRSQGKEL